MNELMKMLVGRVPSGGHAWKQITATAELAEQAGLAGFFNKPIKIILRFFFI